MYAKGMTTRQISDTIEDIYGFDVSEGVISDVTDKILPQIEDWQNRPLDEVYPVVYIDAIHYSVRDNGIIRKMAAYVILGIKEAIAAAYPDTEYQRCMVHMVRNTMKYVPSKNVRKIIYATNAIESLNSSYRKLNRQRSVFPSDQALMKALYLATFEATKKWTQPIHNWGPTYGEMCIMYEGRLPD